MGEHLPSPGLGTWANTDPEQCASSVETALETGYRHIDTAQMYGNEAAVGQGVKRASVPRDDILVATKVAPAHLGYEDVLETAAESADRLDVSTIDLLYVHWPRGQYDPADTLPAFDRLRDEGTIRHIGLSNFEPDQLDTAIETLSAPVVAHQVEMHPLLHQEALRQYATNDDHHLVAYSPLARGAALRNSTVTAVAESHDATPAQVCLAWLRAKGTVPIPKATGGGHIRENWAAVELDLDPSAVERIDQIDGETRVVDPAGAPWNR